MSFDYKIAADLCCGRKISRGDARDFASDARWNYERAEANLKVIEDLRRKLELREAEIRLLKDELLERGEHDGA